MLFADLRLAEPILRAVSYPTPSPIQAQAIPHILEGRDVLGSAQTGTGKTAAFSLPILHRLSQAGRPGGKPRARALVLCPTRELANQTADCFREYGRHLDLKGTVIFGGVGERPQINMLRRGVDVIIATPGRLLDLMRQGHVDLTLIEVVVLDEADRMLDMGFINDIRSIIAKISPKRQTLMFSATMPREIRQLASTLLRNPAVVEVVPPATTVTAIDQSVYFVDKTAKPELLARLVKDLPMHRAIVFTRTKHGADRVVKHLDRYGIRSMAIHGNKSQNVRERALNDFRNNKTHVLVATDIASRGIDVDGITHVVNYDLTHEPETYVHRIGRTARAGATGAAVAFCDPEEMGNLRAIERMMRKSIPVKTHQIRKSGGDHLSPAPAYVPLTPAEMEAPIERAPTPARRHEQHPIDKRRSQGPNGQRSAPAQHNANRAGGHQPHAPRTNGHQPSAPRAAGHVAGGQASGGHAAAGPKSGANRPNAGGNRPSYSANKSKFPQGGGARPQANGRPGHPSAPKADASRRPSRFHPLAASGRSGGVPQGGQRRFVKRDR